MQHTNMSNASLDGENTSCVWQDKTNSKEEKQTVGRKQNQATKSIVAKVVKNGDTQDTPTVD